MDVLIVGAGPGGGGSRTGARHESGREHPGARRGRSTGSAERGRTTKDVRARTQWVVSFGRGDHQPGGPSHEGSATTGESRNFGSSFPFDDFGQLRGVRGEDDVNTRVISGAYGGFSNTWGAQTMVNSAASFATGPSRATNSSPTTAPYSRAFRTRVNPTT